MRISEFATVAFIAVFPALTCGFSLASASAKIVSSLNDCYCGGGNRRHVQEKRSKDAINDGCHCGNNDGSFLEGTSLVGADINANDRRQVRGLKNDKKNMKSMKMEKKGNSNKGKLSNGKLPKGKVNNSGKKSSNGSEKMGGAGKEIPFPTQAPISQNRQKPGQGVKSSNITATNSPTMQPPSLITNSSVVSQYNLSSISPSSSPTSSATKLVTVTRPTSNTTGQILSARSATKFSSSSKAELSSPSKLASGLFVPLCFFLLVVLMGSGVAVRIFKMKNRSSQDEKSIPLNEKNSEVIVESRLPNKSKKGKRNLDDSRHSEVRYA